MYSVHYLTLMIVDWQRGDFDQGAARAEALYAWAVGGGARTAFFVFWGQLHRARFAMLRGDVAKTREWLPAIADFFKARLGASPPFQKKNKTPRFFDRVALPNFCQTAPPPLFLLLDEPQ